MLTPKRRTAHWVGVGGLALAVRLAYVLGTAPRKLLFTDSLFYQLQANYLAKGYGFVMPTILRFKGTAVPSAAHPPLYPLYLAAGSLVGVTSVQAHQVMGCLVGVATVLGVGLVAREVAGERAGLVAATLAAVYPPLWLNDGGIAAEGLFALLISGIVLASYRFLARPSPRIAVVLGVAIGLAILTRAEAVLLIPVLVVPLVLVVKGLTSRQQVARLAVIVLASAAIVGPWVVRNLLTFERPVTLSTGDAALAGANCRSTYHGRLIGLWVFGGSCFPAKEPPGDESVSAAAQRDQGLSYIQHHLARAPLVAVVRVARVWQVFGPVQDADIARDDNRPKWGNRVGLAAYAAVLPLAVAGAVVLRRRRIRLLPLTAQIVGVSVTAALVWGAIRFRAPAEVVVMVLSGVAIDAAWSRRGGRIIAGPASALQYHGRST